MEVIGRVSSSAARAVYLGQREMLKPRVLLGVPGRQRAFGQLECVVVLAQVEENSRQVQQSVRIVWSEKQRSAETLDRTLRVALDSPVVADLVVDL